jgi:hypothetical protein
VPPTRAAASRADAPSPSRRRSPSIPASATPTASPTKAPTPHVRPLPPATTPSTPRMGGCSPPSSARASTTSPARSPTAPSPSSSNGSPNSRSPRSSSRPATAPCSSSNTSTATGSPTSSPDSKSATQASDRLRRHTPPRRRLDPPLPHHRAHRRSRADLTPKGRSQLTISDPYRIGKDLRVEHLLQAVQRLLTASMLVETRPHLHPRSPPLRLPTLAAPLMAK